MQHLTKKLLAGVAAAGLVLGTTAIAGADEVKNNVGQAGRDTIVADGETTVGYFLKSENASQEGPGGLANCNATASNPVTVSISVPAGVTASRTSFEFTDCASNGTAAAAQAVTFSSSAVGAYSVTHTTSGQGVNKNDADFTLTVLPGAASGLVATAGNQQAGLSWNASPHAAQIDGYKVYQGAGATPVATVTGTSATVTGLVNGTQYCYTVKAYTGMLESSASNQACATPTAVVADTTNPTITSVSINDGDTWTNSTSVTVDIVATDNIGLAGYTLSNSGITGTTPAVTPFAGTEVSHTLSSDDGTKTVYVRVFDAAGNYADSSDTIGLDTAPPTSSVTGPTEGGVYATAPAVTCTADDGTGSGVATHGSPTGNTTTAGPKSVTCTGATDNAGNTQTDASDPVTYTVAPIGGFNSNFDSTTSVLKVKPNQAIPLKWAFSDGTANHALLSATTLSSISSNSCSGGSDGTETAVTEASAGSSGLQLLTDNSYQMNWKATSTTGCRRVTATMTFTSGGTATRTILVNIAK